MASNNTNTNGTDSAIITPPPYPGQVEVAPLTPSAPPPAYEEVVGLRNSSNKGAPVVKALQFPVVNPWEQHHGKVATVVGISDGSGPSVYQPVTRPIHQTRAAAAGGRYPSTNSSDDVPPPTLACYVLIIIFCALSIFFGILFGVIATTMAVGAYKQAQTTGTGASKAVAAVVVACLGYTVGSVLTYLYLGS